MTTKVDTVKWLGTDLKVETVKWSWASAVQSKNVYRDDEFIRTETRGDSLKAIDYMLNKPKGLTYTITVHRDEEYFTYWRHSMPCLGGFVKYRDSHGPRHFMNPYFPRDIRVAFPEGDIIYIGCNRQGTKDAFKKNPYNDFIFSQESPWVAAFGTKESIIFKDNYFVLTNMNTDPTVFYSLMRLGGFAYAQIAPARDPKAFILASKTSTADPRRLAGQKPLKISGGTWAEGFGYTRPYNESIFKTALPNKLADFGKLAGYPNAPYTNAYFITEMKKTFGVDFNASAAHAPDKKLDEALVKAWDYFKEKASELSEYTDDAKPMAKSIYGAKKAVTKKAVAAKTPVKAKVAA